MKNIVVVKELRAIKSELSFLRGLLVKNVDISPLSDVSLLRLTATQIRCLVALRLLCGVWLHASASDVAKVLDIKRCMASKYLCELARLGLVLKVRVGRRVFFRSNNGGSVET